MTTSLKQRFKGEDEERNDSGRKIELDLVSRNPAEVWAALDCLLGRQLLHLHPMVRHRGHPRHVGVRHLLREESCFNSLRN